MRFGPARVLSLLLANLAAGTAGAEPCRGNSDALGTHRTIAVDPREHGRIGSMNYSETLPLVDKEVVLTFDDGPLPPYSGRVLDILASHCVSATYFVVGRMAKAYPDVLRRIRAEGHTIGTHSLSHPIPFRALGLERARAEIVGGIAAAAAVLGEPAAVAPFFRFPGLGRTDPVEDHLGRRGLMVWSADFPADDWRRIGAGEIVRRALNRLEVHGKGILLLHDIQPATVLALPTLLAELKARGYRIVHVVPAGADRPKTPTVASQWRLRPYRQFASLAFTLSDVRNPDGARFVARAEDELCSLPLAAPAAPVRSARRGKTQAAGTAKLSMPDIHATHY